MTTAATTTPAHFDQKRTPTSLQRSRAGVKIRRPKGVDIRCRLTRPGGYPPLRGTWVRLAEDEAILYTIGSTPFYRTYPGLYSPNPVLIRRQRGETSIHELAREILALTKLNWNRARFDNAKPITVRASHQVGDVLRYTPDDQAPAQRYSFYM